LILIVNFKANFDNFKFKVVILLKMFSWEVLIVKSGAHWKKRSSHWY
jgi:hypothetical protein